MDSEKELIVWAGTEESLREYAAALASATQLQIKDPKAFSNAQASDQSPLLTLSGDLARVCIKGPLVNSDNPYLAYFGVISYNEIRRALIGAVNAGAKDIVLDIHSGGGQVAGVSDTARLIAQINKGVASVTSYTDGTMASAAYWLGCSAGKVYASDVSVVGSIGVLMVHIDQSEMLKDMKIKATIIRSGKYKALANGYEPLSKVAKDEMQAQVDAIDKIFVTHVAESRGVSYAVAQAEMAQGREFIADAAVTAGLIDGISSYDAVIGGLTSNRKNLDKSKTMKNNKMKQQYGADNMTTKNALTEADIAALAAGGAAASVTLTAEQTAAADLAAKAAADAAKEVADKAAATAKEVADKATADAAAAAAKDTELVTFLRGELKDREAKLLESTVAVRDLTAKVTSIEGTHSALLAIAADSANNMRVALGQVKVDVKTLTAEALLIQHKALVTDFSAKFKVGGVAATGAEAAASAEVTNPTVHSARIKATRSAPINK